MASKKKVNAAKKKKSAPARKKKAPATKKKAAPRKKAAAKKKGPARKKAPPTKKAPARKKAAPKRTRPQPTITPKERLSRLATPVVDVVEEMQKEAKKKRLAPTVNLRGPALSQPPAAPDAEPQGSDRRIFLRVPYGAWVNVVRDGRQEFCLARDISMGGVFLKANPPPQLGEAIRLLLVIENDSAPLELQGAVVRRSESEGGFGIRFEGLTPAVEERLRDVVADASAALWKPPAGSPTSAPQG